jgi:hypothetical protein
METLCPVTRERLSFFAGKYKVLARDSLLSYVISLALSFLQAARFLGNGRHPYFWGLM